MMRLKKRKLAPLSGFKFLFVSILSSPSLVAPAASDVVEEDEEDDEAAAGSGLQMLFKDERLLRLNLFFL